MSGKIEDPLLQQQFAKIIIQPLLLVLDQELRVESADPAFLHFFNCRPDETIGRQIYEICREQWNFPEVRYLLEELLAASDWVEDYKITRKFKSIGEQTLLLNAARVHMADDRVSILLGISFATEQVMSETQSSENMRT
jgi:two-component system CheB/CheR fusion protein